MKAALEQAADDMKQYYNWNRQVAPEYKVRDKAWLSLQNYSSDCPMKKLDHKWVLSPLPRSSPLPPSNYDSLPGRRTSTLSYPSPASAPTCQMISLSVHNLCNPAPSSSTTKRNMRLRKSWTPGSGGVSYGTWSNSLAGHTQITCGFPILRSTPQQ